MIPKPITAVPNLRRDTVRLSFDIGPSPVEMYIRGSVAWPEGKIPGMALVAGQDIQNRHIWVFDDYQFLTVEPLFIKNRSRDIGLSLFLRDIWMRYGCNRLFYEADTLVHQFYSRQVYRDGILRPIGTAFIKVPYKDENITDDNVKTRVELKTLHWSLQSDLDAENKNPDSPARHALRTLVAGFEYLPWRDWSKTEELKEVYI